MQCNMPYVIVLSSARSGSNWLLRLLQSSNSTKVYGEVGKRDYFKNDRGSRKLALDLGREHKELRARYGAAPQELVELARKKYAQQNLIFGCKVFYYHVDASPWLESFVLAPNARVIHLYRVRVFETFTSIKLARTTGAWHSIAYPDDALLDFDEAEYLKFRTRCRAGYQRWCKKLTEQKRPGTTLEMEYRAIGTPSALDELQGFLGIDDMTLPNMKKQSTRPALDYWRRRDLAEPYLADSLIGNPKPG